MATPGACKGMQRTSAERRHAIDVAGVVSGACQLRETAMSREADTIHTDQGSIARLQALVKDLPDNAKVRLHLHDGNTLTGIVTVVPTVQNLVDATGTEGANGVVKLIDNDRPTWSATVSLDTIARVEHLDSVVYGTSQT
jgi:hypothetical protein